MTVQVRVRARVGVGVGVGVGVRDRDRVRVRARARVRVRVRVRVSKPRPKTREWQAPRGTGGWLAVAGRGWPHLGAAPGHPLALVKPVGAILADAWRDLSFDMVACVRPPGRCRRNSPPSPSRQPLLRYQMAVSTRLQ